MSLIKNSALPSLLLLLSASVPSSLTIALGAGCSSDSSGANCSGDQCDDIDNFVEIDHGRKWEQFRELYRYTSQGSRMIPYKWLLHLEQADTQSRFVNAANMKRLGFNLEHTRSNDAELLNPDNLPIGVVKDPRAGLYGEEWAGITCAACHTSTVTYKNTSFLVDGGSGMLDLQRTEEEMLAAVKATVNDVEKLSRFSEAVLGADSTPEERSTLKENLGQFITLLGGRISRNTPAVPGALVGQAGTLDLRTGPGRVDAFTILINETICNMLPEPDNCRPANTPTSYAQLWGIGDLDWAQTNSLTHAVLGRNVGEVLGVYAHSSLANCGPENPQVCDFLSTTNVDNLVSIEDWLKDLDAPKWPKEFGAIDSELARKGGILYEDNCVTCHTLPDDFGKYPESDPNPDDPNACRKFVATKSTPICFDYGGVDLLGGLAAANCEAPQVIGTDPFLAANVLARKGKTGILAPIFDGREVVSAAELLGTMQTLLIRQGFARDRYTPEEISHAMDYRASASPPLAQLTGYKARPLAGIAFAAPYLHNNSISSIYELLQQPAERASEFWVGRREYDPAKLGYLSGPPNAGENLFRFDTKIPGNLNIGHEFGTAASTYVGQGDREADRMALLEFIKTLDTTPRTEPTTCGI